MNNTVENKKAPHVREIQGVVASVSPHKTIQVRVEHIKMHEKYRKQYTEEKSFAVHDEKNIAKVGDTVVCRESRPLSKTKRWRLIQIVTKATA